MPRWLILATALIAPSARADTFMLLGGGKIEGQLLNVDEQPRQTYQIQTSWGLVQVDAQQIKRVAADSEAEQNYRQYVLKMPPTLEGNWRMAEWCRESGLDRLRIRHLEQVLSFDPNHEGARRALGYGRNDNGQWQLGDLVQRDGGYIFHGGKWVLPEEILLARQARQRVLAEKNWRSRIQMWRTWIVKRRGKEGEGEHHLRAIRDPLAAPALVELFEDEDEPQALKMLYLDVLGSMGQGVGAMIKAALEDPDRTMRSKCLDFLEKLAPVAASRAFVTGLKSADNKQVNRAAVGLSRMRDRSSVMRLIDALITEHKFKINTGAGLNPTFSGNGGGSFGVGGKPKIVKRNIQNPAVRDALAVMLGVNYGFDQERWRQWYIAKNQPETIQLRRSD